MKKLLVLCSLVVMLVGLTALNAAAVPINGDISFGGNVGFSSTEFTSFSGVTVTTAVGDYSTVPTGGFSPAVTFNPFTFVPLSTPTPLWTFVYGANTYSFDVATMILVNNDLDFKYVRGTGVANITGSSFDPTVGTWIMSASNTGTAFSFQSTNGVHGVPEPTVLLLLGFGLVGLAGVRRKLKK